MFQALGATQPSPESSQPCEEESQPGVWGTVEDVIDILFHRKVTAAQTFVLKLFVSDLKIKYFSNKKTYTIDLISLPLHLFKVICLNVFGISLNLCSCYKNPILPKLRGLLSV